MMISLYPLYRPMFLVINGEATADIDKFINFTLSDQGQKVIAEMGMIRVH